MDRAGHDSNWQLAFRSMLLLAQAIQLISDPHRWTRKGYALDGRGRQVPVDDSRARRFCTIGAVLRAEHELTGEPMPVVTDPAPEIDDLNLPVAPAAPPHLGLALDVLGYSTLREFHAQGISTVTVSGAAVSLRHTPMVLGLHRRFGHREALNALTRAVGSIAALNLDPASRDRLLDEEPGSA